MFWTVKQMNILNQLLTFFAKICKLKKIQNYQAFCKFLFSKELKFNFNLLMKIFIFILNPMSVELFFSIIGVRRGGGLFFCVTIYYLHRFQSIVEENIKF